MSNPCVNGTCIDEVNGFTCNCSAGFYRTLLTRLRICVIESFLVDCMKYLLQRLCAMSLMAAASIHVSTTPQTALTSFPVTSTPASFATALQVSRATSVTSTSTNASPCLAKTTHRVLMTSTSSLAPACQASTVRRLLFVPSVLFLKRYFLIIFRDFVRTGRRMLLQPLPQQRDVHGKFHSHLERLQLLLC